MSHKCFTNWLKTWAKSPFSPPDDPYRRHGYKETTLFLYCRIMRLIFVFVCSTKQVWHSWEIDRMIVWLLMLLALSDFVLAISSFLNISNWHWLEQFITSKEDENTNPSCIKHILEGCTFFTANILTCNRRIKAQVLLITLGLLHLSVPVNLNSVTVNMSDIRPLRLTQRNGIQPLSNTCVFSTCLL